EDGEADDFQRVLDENAYRLCRRTAHLPSVVGEHGRGAAGGIAVEETGRQLQEFLEDIRTDHEDDADAQLGDAVAGNKAGATTDDEQAQHEKGDPLDHERIALDDAAVQQRLQHVDQRRVGERIDGHAEYGETEQFLELPGV